MNNKTLEQLQDERYELIEKENEIFKYISDEIYNMLKLKELCQDSEIEIKVVSELKKSLKGNFIDYDEIDVSIHFVFNNSCVGRELRFKFMKSSKVLSMQMTGFGSVIVGDKNKHENLFTFYMITLAKLFKDKEEIIKNMDKIFDDKRDIVNEINNKEGKLTSKIRQFKK